VTARRTLTRLRDLDDVPAAAPDNGQVPVWDTATSKFVWQAPTPAAHAHAEADVTNLVSDLASRPRPFHRSGSYYGPLMGTHNTMTPGSNSSLYCMPLWIGEPITLDRIGIRVNTAGEAGSVIRLGIYADDSDGLPGARLLDAGTVVSDSVGNKEITISFAVNAGLIWLAAAFQAAPTTRPNVFSGSRTVLPLGHNGAIDPNVGPAGVFQLGVGGALPNPFVPNTTVNDAPRVVVRAA
jgi:hypothetical protein